MINVENDCVALLPFVKMEKQTMPAAFVNPYIMASMCNSGRK